MLNRIMDRAMLFLLALGCLALLAMVLLTAADVGLRYFFSSPISASYELSEILMGVFAPVAILYCAYRNSHVCVDILFEHFSPGMQRAALFLSNAAVLLCAVLLTWQSWHLIGELRETGLTSATRDLPMWPLACVFLLAFALYIPTAAIHLRRGEKQ